MQAREKFESKMAWSSFNLSPFLFVIFVVNLNSAYCWYYESSNYISAIGDPGMKNPNVRVALEAWNSCNEVGNEVPFMGSPKIADCTDHGNNSTVIHRVKESDNKLATGQKFPSNNFKPHTNPDLYVAEKERYLGSLCAVDTASKNPWSFWKIMLKNGNFDTNSTLCPEDGKKVSKIETDRKFPCFGKGCMNPPLVYHNYSRFVTSSGTLSGRFFGTYDVDADLSNGVGKNVSYFEVSWEKNPSSGSWVFSNRLTTSPKYPWLMLYLRADGATGFNGGYHYDGRGIMRKLPESPNFKVRLTLKITSGGGNNSQFYLSDIGSCWKNNGDPCDGDTTTDVTRYSEMIINPNSVGRCKPSNLKVCPPYHVTVSGEKIYRNETTRFPYSAYHLYCSPGNAQHLEEPINPCDPYSNPQAQELVQILPHSEWAVHGYPNEQGDGWIGDPRTWELDVGALSDRLYFYQDPGTKPARRVWTSINVGTEIYVTEGPSEGETAEWSVSDFDVIVPQDVGHANCCSNNLWYLSISIIMSIFLFLN